jgi:hypothetical protein
MPTPYSPVVAQPNRESWQRTIFEALRPIDSAAVFWLGLVEPVDFSEAAGHRLDDFPAEQLRRWVDEWLLGLDPDSEPAQREWSGGGVRLHFRAVGRRHENRGWTAMPSFNQLEQRMSQLHLVGDADRDFISLSREEVERLARGELRLVGQGASYQAAFEMLAGEMHAFGCGRVADLHPTVITSYAGMLGLVDAAPSVGNFEQGWRAIQGMPPSD